MTIEWACATPVSKPWGRTDLLPWSQLGGSGEAVGEIRFERSGRDAPRPALLLKLLFTAEALSIQVHPDDALARSMGLPNGKSEAWYILDAAKGAEVGLGLVQTLDAKALRAAIEGERIVDLVDWKRVRAGDFLSVPAGTIHALGTDLVVAEIQQNSDTTFRLFDYRRPRPLHLDESVAAARAGPAEPQSRPLRLSASRTLLTDQPRFIVEKLEFAPGSAWCLRAEQETWLLLIGGRACCAQREAGFGEALLVESEAMHIRVGPEGLTALVAYPGPLQVSLLKEAEAAEVAASHPPPGPPTAEPPHRAAGALA
jgi:mannose-6-phosphate isomerase